LIWRRNWTIEIQAKRKAKQHLSIGLVLSYFVIFFLIAGEKVIVDEIYRLFSLCLLEVFSSVLFSAFFTL
jgi:hypothetical protein